MINFIKDTFKTLNLTFLIRNYFFGILIYCLFMYLSLYDQSGQIKQPIHYGNIAYFTISLILYPFATFIWEEIKRVILGNNIIITNLFVMIIVKFFIKVTIFLVSIFVGLIGILLLWIYRKRMINNDSN